MPWHWLDTNSNFKLNGELGLLPNSVRNYYGDTLTTVLSDF